MAAGVQGAAVVICFMSPAYQSSANCKLELKFARQSGVPIVPAMLEPPPWRATGWLGLVTAGALWTPLHGTEGVSEGAVHKLLGQIEKQTRDEAELTAEAHGGGSGAGDKGVGAFSVREMRLELERLRMSVAAIQSKAAAAYKDPAMCAVPSTITSPGPSTVVTPVMSAMLAAVVSQGSRAVGFLGVGGVGKTTTTAWIVQQRETRMRFDRIAWITLGQTPHLNKFAADLYMQLTGKHISCAFTSRAHSSSPLPHRIFSLPFLFALLPSPLAHAPPPP
jgi:hypothetical protein